jgi:deoxyadenosine/deoxycytidine kinase
MNYIVIEGNIGAGKTSLAEGIAKDTNARLVLEKFAENPFLPKFYSEPEKYAFQLELSFLAERYRQQKEELMSRNMFAPKVVADYFLSKSLIFAGITLREDEYLLYRQLYNIIQQPLPLPELYVYLHSSVDRLIENIKERGRVYEQSIDQDYLKKLQDGYFNFMKSRSDLKILLLDIEKIDFVNKKVDFVKIKSVIFGEKFKTGITRVVL